MSVAVFRRRASDHVDGSKLTAYRNSLAVHFERIEAICDTTGEVAEDLRRRIREPDEVSEVLTAAEAELDEIALAIAEQEAPEPLRALHAEFDANLERALRGVVTIERGCGLTRLPHASIYDDEPQAYWKRGHLNIIHAQMRMREIADILFSWKSGMPADASVAARIQQMGA
ncbi:MAG TPA: hypothetical protein VIA02_05640 [Candidatus Limnocylindria bacterium]|jgi:hypothetical protein